MIFHPTRLVGVAMLLALFTGGCATQTGTKPDAAGYDYVTVTGSNMPVRVPKSTQPKSAENATVTGTNMIGSDALTNERMNAVSPTRSH